MNLDPMSLTYLTRVGEPAPEVRFREEYELSKANRREAHDQELIEPERRREAQLLRERVVMRLGRFLARP